jgi:hypothetical protein
MPEVVLVRNEDGKLAGLGEKNRKRFDKFKRVADAMEIGETLCFSYKLPRSPQHHGFFFAKLHELFKRQEKFTQEDWLLEWLKVGAGYADLLPGLDGIPVAIPRSISWGDCDEQTFIEVAQAIEDYMWTDDAQLCLWPHLDARLRHEAVEGWHEQAELNRQFAIARMQEAGR